MSSDLSVAGQLREAALRLQAAGVGGAARDARLLLADVLGVDAGDLIARDHAVLCEGDVERFTAAIVRRAAGEPVSRIRGWRDFYGRRFEIDRHVLDPRADTELLVDVGLKRSPDGGRVLDLGTGSGCVLISILAERAGVSGVGVDVSAESLAVARGNAEALAVSDRVRWIEGSWDAGDGEFDVVVSNPPYIRRGEISGLATEVRAHDPHLALDGGKDGLDAVRDILKAAEGYLRPGGWLALEVGFDQTDAVMELATAAGWKDVDRRLDLGGNYRVVEARRA